MIGAAGVALGSAGDLLADAHGREVGILGQQGLDPRHVRIEQAGARAPSGTRAAASSFRAAATVCASSAVAGRSPGRRVSRSPRGGGSRPTKRRSWRVPPWLGSRGGGHLPEQFAEQHQPLAWFRAAADARRRQRQHLDQRQLVGDQIAVEQFLPGLLQNRRRQPQPAGQRVVAVERQARGGRPRPRGRSTAAWLRATDGRHARAGNGDPPRTSPSRADAAVARQPECVLDRIMLGTPVEQKRDRTRTLSQDRGLAGRGHRLRTGAAGEPGHAGGGRGDVALAVSGCCPAPPRAGGLVLLLACAAALESAAAQPLAFTIQHPANGLTAGGAAVACLVAARLQGRFMAPRPVAQGSRRKNFCCVTTRRRNFRRLRWLWRRRWRADGARVRPRHAGL